MHSLVFICVTILRRLKRLAASIKGGSMEEFQNKAVTRRHASFEPIHVTHTHTQKK